MERKITIIYRWWCVGEVKKEHVAALEEDARERISEMAKQGYTYGELSSNIRATDDDPEDGIDYSGWWELKEECL